MLFRGVDAQVAELAGQVRRQLPGLVERTVAAILDELPVYRDQVFVAAADLRRSVARNLDVAVRTLEGAAQPDLTQATLTGEARARQGAPLPDLVRAYRIGLTEVWRVAVALLDEGRPGDLGVLVSVTTAIWALADDYAEALTTAYRGMSAELMIAHQAQRSAMVEALFAGGSATEGLLWDVARVLDLSVEGEFLVVAAETPTLGREPLEGIEARLRALHHASAWRLTPDLQAGVVSLHRPDAVSAVRALLAEGSAARVGLSPVYAGLDHTSRALHFARVALSTLPAGQAGTVQFTESPLAGLVASSPLASVELSRQVLGPVLGLPGGEADVLVATLRAWFAGGGSTNHSAERLFCHPNTVRLRLRRIADLLGRSLTDPEHVAEVGAALWALHIFPTTQLRDGIESV